MQYLLKICFSHKKVVSWGLLLAALLLAVWHLLPAQHAAEAQGADTDRVTYASANGASAIVSQQVILAAEDFARAGVAEAVMITPGGLTLAEGANQGVYISQVIRSPLDFTTDIGPAWLADVPAGAVVAVETRLSNDGQSWGDWSPVPVEYYPTRNGEYGGVLVWADAAELYVQFKVTLQAGANGTAPVFRKLTLFFNDTSQGPSDEMAVAQARQSEVGLASLTCPAKPLVIPRTVWGCPPDETSPWWPPKYQPVTHIVINHTATPNTAQDWAAVVRSIWHYHAHILGWGDVGYQYLIDPVGNIYEGRAGGDDVIGAFDGFNRGAMGIGYIGCYGNCDYLGIANAEPSAAMLTAGNNLMAWKVDQKNLDPFGSGEYCHQNLSNIVSRSEVTCRGGSLSPGDFLDAKVPEMRQAVADIIAACQEATPTPGLTVIVTVETTTPDPTTETPTPTATPSATPTEQTPTSTSIPSPTSTLTPTPTSTPTTSPDDPTVGLSPAFLLLALGGSETAQVEVADIADLYGVDLRLSYDPEVVEVVDADPDTPGVQVALGSVFEGVETFMVENEVSDGVINIAVARRSPAPPFAGTGSLIAVTWQAKAFGETPVVFEQVKLSNPNGVSLAATTQDGLIEVSLSVIIKGQITLQGSDNASGAVVRAGEKQIETGADGTFELAAASTDPYRLTVTAPGYLSAQAEGNLLASATMLDLGVITLLGGDATGDNQIDIFDLALIGSRYGSSDAGSDVNRNGQVDIFDLTLSAANYGRQGPVVLGVD
ncbi:MAG: N-acetylmuramoyl-L-alanine amidase [Anaerolineae bacterium]|nr:N-acetylmuramoyl-L-alanine amidase [Anaerolineae bacterium]